MDRDMRTLGLLRTHPGVHRHLWKRLSFPSLCWTSAHNTFITTTKLKAMRLRRRPAEVVQPEGHSAGPLDQCHPDGETKSAFKPEADEHMNHMTLPNEPKKKYECLTCGRVFSVNTGLRRHLVIHTGKRPFKCFICGRGFSQSGNVKTHMKVHRGELPNWTLLRETAPPGRPPVAVHVCGECGMDFPEKQRLDEHKASHKKAHACPDCDKTFKNEYYFKIHRQVHTGHSPFFCSECGKGFLTGNALKKHTLTHTGERKFQCERCGKAFLQSSHLKVHLRTHTGDRPHLCSICGKSYSKAFTLKVHLRVHTGENPYRCEECGKCFYYSQGYQKHLKVHNKKPKPQSRPLGRPRQLQVVYSQ